MDWLKSKLHRRPTLAEDQDSTYYKFESYIRTGRTEEALFLVDDLTEEEVKTGLWYAALYGRCPLITPLVEKLKSFGIMTIEKYLTDDIMVNQSISVAAEKGMLKAMQMLMDIGAPLETKNADDMTCLLSAAAHNHAEVVEFCLRSGVKADTRDKFGNVALHYAARHASEATARVLVAFTSSPEYINAVNKDGYTPLDEAFRNCTLPVAEFLMGVNADVNNVKKIMEKDRNGMTSLQLAVRAGKVDVVKFLCDKKVPLRSKDLGGNTALHTAARHDHHEIVGILVNSGIDLSVRNEQGNTALAIARKCQFELCADIIARATSRRLVSVYGVTDAVDITIGVGGAPGAGKTTFLGSYGRSRFWSYFTNEEKPDQEDKELSSRTRGIRIERIRDPLGSPMVFHFLDFGGHQEYIPSHSLFISESTTPAMAVCLVNCNKPEETLYEEMELWCGVFISCHRLNEDLLDEQEPQEPEPDTPPSEGYDSDMDNDIQLRSPSVVGTSPQLPDNWHEDEEEREDVVEPQEDAAADAPVKKDTETEEDNTKTEDAGPIKMPFLLLATRFDSEEGKGACIQAVMNAYRRIKDKFRHRLAFQDAPVFLNAQKSQKDGMREARTQIQRLSRRLLDLTPKTPQLINAVRKVLPEVRNKFYRPFTTREKFGNTLLDVLESQKTGKGLQQGVRSLLDAVLQLLSFCGELVVFTKPELEDIVVLKADWLLTEVVGHLCSPRNFRNTIEFNDDARAPKKVVEKALSCQGGPGDKILKMIETIGICIIDEEEVILPSKLPDHRPREKQTQIGLWEKDDSLTDYAGIYYKCDGGVPMSPGVAPLMQTKCYNLFKKDHDSSSYLWRRGIRVQPWNSQVQGAVCVSPSRLGIYIACRGPPNSQRYMYALIQILSKRVLEVVDSVSPGSTLQKWLLSPNELKRLVEKSSAEYPTIFYKPDDVALLMDSKQETVIPADSAKHGISDNVVNLLHLPDTHVHLMSTSGRRLLVQAFDAPTLRSPHVKIWHNLAERLEFAPSRIEHMKTLPDPVEIILDEWGRRGYNNSYNELRRLCSDLSFDAGRVLEDEARRPFFGEPNVFTAKRKRFLKEQEERERQRQQELRQQQQSKQQQQQSKRRPQTVSRRQCDEPNDSSGLRMPSPPHGASGTDRVTGNNFHPPCMGKGHRTVGIGGQPNVQIITYPVQLSEEHDDSSIDDYEVIDFNDGEIRTYTASLGSLTQENPRLAAENTTEETVPTIPASSDQEVPVPMDEAGAEAESCDAHPCIIQPVQVTLDVIAEEEEQQADIGSDPVIAQEEEGHSIPETICGIEESKSLGLETIPCAEQSSHDGYGVVDVARCSEHRHSPLLRQFNVVTTHASDWDTPGSTQYENVEETVSSE